MWVKTFDGSLINLDLIQCVYLNADKKTVLASCSSVAEEDEDYILFIGTETECKNVIKRLMLALDAMAL